jgi:3-oxoacyl-[acyl-carrier protein] reductase
LTAPKESGSTIEIGGKKVALGIPTGPKPVTDAVKFAHIPLGREGTAEEAAAAILLYVQFFDLVSRDQEY